MLRKLIKARSKSGFYKPPAEARIDRPGYACMANAGSTTEEHVQRHAPLVTKLKRGYPGEVTMRKTLASHMDSPRFGKKRGQS